jgi:hypothetical protein
MIGEQEPRKRVLLVPFTDIFDAKRQRLKSVKEVKAQKQERKALEQAKATFAQPQEVINIDDENKADFKAPPSSAKKPRTEADDPVISLLKPLGSGGIHSVGLKRTEVSLSP